MIYNASKFQAYFLHLLQMNQTIKKTSRFSAVYNILSRSLSNIRYPSQIDMKLMKPIQWKSNRNRWNKQFWKYAKTNDHLCRRRRLVYKTGQFHYHPLNTEKTSRAEKFRWSEFRQRMIYRDFV